MVCGVLSDAIADILKIELLLWDMCPGLGELSKSRLIVRTKLCRPALAQSSHYINITVQASSRL